ncbi:MAG: HAD family hydrolase [Acidobacteria bacterium]|nr:HAD family hydrolase [Acidobacteriota bacterium]
MKNIKWLFFDLFDTIVYVDEEIYYKGKREAAELAGIDADDFISAWRSTSEDALLGKLKDPFQRATEALKRMGITDRHISAKIAIYDIETLQRCVSFYDGATETLSVLREKGFNLALLSNATATTAFILAPLHLRDRFDQLILSYEIGLKKPDPQFFKIALERTNAKKEESIFIGDGANRELDAAREAGILTIRINHPNKAHTFMDKSNLSSSDHFEVKSFTELLKYLGC